MFLLFMAFFGLTLCLFPRSVLQHVSTFKGQVMQMEFPLQDKNPKELPGSFAVFSVNGRSQGVAHR